jgi:hypothetical protein
VSWTKVEPAFVAIVDADATYTAMMGGRKIEPDDNAAPRRVPQTRYGLIWDFPGENTGNVGYQFTIWAETREKVAAAHDRLRALLHRRKITVGGTTLWMLYMETREHRDTQPGVGAVELDFRFVPVR